LPRGLPDNPGTNPSSQDPNLPAPFPFPSIFLFSSLHPIPNSHFYFVILFIYLFLTKILQKGRGVDKQMDTGLDQARGQHHALLPLANGNAPPPPHVRVDQLLPLRPSFCQRASATTHTQAAEPTMMVTLCRDSEVRSGRKVKDLMTMVPYDLSRVFIVKDSTNEARGVLPLPLTRSLTAPELCERLLT
jgi:hypothetical protein